MVGCNRNSSRRMSIINTWAGWAWRRKLSLDWLDVLTKVEKIRKTQVLWIFLETVFKLNVTVLLTQIVASFCKSAPTHSHCARIRMKRFCWKHSVCGKDNMKLFYFFSTKPISGLDKTFLIVNYNSLRFLSAAPTVKLIRQDGRQVLLCLVLWLFLPSFFFFFFAFHPDP